MLMFLYNFFFRNLQQLSLAGNPMTKIVPALNNIPKLSIFSLSETEISEIPKLAFKSNINLTMIYMRKMKYLYSVNECAFCKLTNLEVFKIYNCYTFK